MIVVRRVSCYQGGKFERAKNQCYREGYLEGFRQGLSGFGLFVVVEKSKDRPDKEAAPEQQYLKQHTITEPGVVSAKNENTNTYKRTEPAQNLFVLPVPAESLLLASFF